MSKEDAAVAITLMWCIWTSRNSYVHGKETFQPRKSLGLVSELVAALELPISGSTTKGTVLGWTPPPSGWFMINTDGSFDQAARKAGSGFVVRDDHGRLVMAGFVPHESVADLFMSDLLACREGMEEASVRGLRQAILQTDCANIVKLWNDPRNLGNDGVQMVFIY